MLEFLQLNVDAWLIFKLTFPKVNGSLMLPDIFFPLV